MKQHNHIRWSATSDQIYIINLDPNFDFTVNIKERFVLPIKKFNFPGGDPHFQVDFPNVVSTQKLIITQRINGSSDFFDILLANDAARRMGFSDIELVIPYFPAARQDRVCNDGEPLTVKVFADLINNCKFSSVVIYGPHSEVAPALLDNVVVLDYDHIYIKRIIDMHPNEKVINIVCPDAGAGKRVGKLVQKLANDDSDRTYNLIRCEKIRDVKDGSLKEFFVQDNDLHGALTIISDDCVAYGGTFLGLADKLVERNCGPLAIFTSHADCQKGLDNLATKFYKVFTTNSKQDFAESDIINLFKIELL